MQRQPQFYSDLRTVNRLQGKRHMMGKENSVKVREST